MISLLKMSKATIGDQVNTQSALVSFLSNIESKDLENVKEHCEILPWLKSMHPLIRKHIASIRVQTSHITKILIIKKPQRMTRKRNVQKIRVRWQGKK